MTNKNTKDRRRDTTTTIFKKYQQILFQPKSKPKSKSTVTKRTDKRSSSSVVKIFPNTGADALVGDDKPKVYDPTSTRCTHHRSTSASTSIDDSLSISGETPQHEKKKKKSAVNKGSQNNNNNNNNIVIPAENMVETSTHIPQQHMYTNPTTEFLQRFRENGSHFISSAYLMSCCAESLHRSSIDETLSTTLAEDVFTLVHVQLTLLDEYLETSNLIWTDTGVDVVLEALLSIFRNIRCKQAHYGSLSQQFLPDIDSCIARANDYWTMSEQTQYLLLDNIITQNRYRHLSWDYIDPTDMTTDDETEEETHFVDLDMDENMVMDMDENMDMDMDRNNNRMYVPDWFLTPTLVQKEADYLMEELTFDAVYASERIAVLIMDDLEMNHDIPRELLSRHWEEDLTNNEIAKYIVNIYAHHLSNVQQSFENDYLYGKVVTALVRGTVRYYIQCFLRKAERARRSSRGRRFGRRFDRHHRRRHGYSSCRHRPEQQQQQRPHFLQKIHNKNRNHHQQQQKESRGGSGDYFRDPQRAILRMTHDIEVFEHFFRNVMDNNRAIQKIITKEFAILKVLFLECLIYASSSSSSSSGADTNPTTNNNNNSWEDTEQDDDDCLDEKFIIVVHKQTGMDVEVTRHFLCDIFLLMNTNNNNNRNNNNCCNDHTVNKTIRRMKQDLNWIKESTQMRHHHQNTTTSRTRTRVVHDNGAGAEDCLSTCRFHAMLKSIYEDRIMVQEQRIFCNNNIRSSSPLLSKEPGLHTELKQRITRKVTNKWKQKWGTVGK